MNVKEIATRLPREQQHCVRTRKHSVAGGEARHACTLYSINACYMPVDILSEVLLDCRCNELLTNKFETLFFWLIEKSSSWQTTSKFVPSSQKPTCKTRNRETQSLRLRLHMSFKPQVVSVFNKLWVQYYIRWID